MKKYPSILPKRKSSKRLPGYDYCQEGAYFITICTHKMRNHFGAIDNHIMILNSLGKIVETEWYRTGELRVNVEIYDDEFIIMPNHFHGIIWIQHVGATGSVARDNSTGIRPNSLGSIIGQFKSQVTIRINKLRGTPGKLVWQRNYYDRIIRNIKEYNDIRNYIQMNPVRWMEKNKSEDNNYK